MDGEDVEWDEPIRVLSEALRRCVGADDAAGVKWLVTKGAEVDDQRGLAMSFAAEEGNLRLVMELLRQGAEPSLSAMLIFATRGSMEACRLLLDILSPIRDTALGMCAEYAFKKKHDHIAKFFWDKQIR